MTEYLDEGWDSRAWDNIYHYFVDDKAICGKGKYHPPYFDKGKVIKENGYCVRCNVLLEMRIRNAKITDFIWGCL